jgi:outer membrane protein
LVVQFAHDRIDGSGAFGDAGGSRNDALIGVQLNVPLYTGGWRSSKEDEAQWLANKARVEAERSAQQASQQTRAAWLGLTAGAARANALAEALAATRLRLDATRLGHEIGDRTTLDLLNAENDAAAAELALLDARVSLLRNRLLLTALAGRLDESELAAINAGLGVTAADGRSDSTQP